MRDGANLRYVDESLDNAMMRWYEGLATDLCATTTATNGYTCLFSLIDSTGTIGGLSTSNVANWSFSVAVTGLAPGVMHTFRVAAQFVVGNAAAVVAGPASSILRGTLTVVAVNK